MTLRELPDGHFTYPRESLFDGSADPQDVQQYSEQVALPYRPLLATGDNGRRILLDTGAGPLGTDTGKLPAVLEAAGVKPASIDVVILTPCPCRSYRRLGRERRSTCIRERAHRNQRS